MSDWRRKDIIFADALWEAIEELSNEVSRNFAVENLGDSVKLLLFGRREMLDRLSRMLHEHQESLGEVAERYGLSDGEKEEK